jgi:hypothetical protein
MESSFNKTYLKTEHIIPYHIHVTHNSRTWEWVMVFNATFKHALAIWWQSVVIGTDCTGSCNSETCVYRIYIVDTNIITYKYNINLCQNFISIWKNNIYFCIFHLFESHQSQRVKYIIAKLKLDLYFVLQVVSPLKKNFINVNYKTELILSGNH